jgi:hypothetical protein
MPNASLYVQTFAFRCFCLLTLLYEGKPANRSQMDTKRKTCDIRTRERNVYVFIDISSTDIDNLVAPLTSAWKPAAQKFLTVVSATSAPTFQLLLHQQNVCHQDGCLADQTDGGH